MLNIMNHAARSQVQTGVKMVIFGLFGIGKTSLLKTLEAPTLCLDFEAGLLAVQDWTGDTISVRTWTDARDIICFICGPNPAFRKDQPYSKAHYEYVCAKYGDPNQMDQYACLFIDSITVAARLCLQWAKSQPDIFTERTGKLDLRGAYGLLASEMLLWLNQLQHLPQKDVILVGILEQKIDEFNKLLWVLQIEGSKIASELPGILDIVIAMVALPEEDSPPKRAFICHTLNPWGYPAKDRSSRLDMIEPPHLGQLIKKIKGADRTQQRASVDAIAPYSPQPIHN